MFLNSLRGRIPLGADNRRAQIIGLFRIGCCELENCKPVVSNKSGDYEEAQLTGLFSRRLFRSCHCCWVSCFFKL